MSQIKETAQLITDVLPPGSHLTAAEIRARAPTAKRVSETLGAMVRRGIARRWGVRHTADGKTEVIFTIDVKRC